jgi:hypothetical protein
VVSDELWFYHAAFSGNSPKLRPGETGRFVQDNAMYAGGSTGLATLRRDGFASMQADEDEGVLLTRPLTFSGQFLFVNVDTPQGELRVDLLDEHGYPIDGISGASSYPVSVNSTRHPITWEAFGDLSALANRPIRFKFSLRSGGLYSFWVSPSPRGESRGFVAAGGPAFSGNQDG